jgi:HD-GYP domain-containing protein (c-di-GMP phosphodiesterase class II)
LVRHHHERWDGRGYPDGLAGEQIAPGARYFAVIDSFDAMTSLRPYRSATGIKATRHAIEELEAGSGTRYWPHAVEVFSRLFHTGRLDWISEYFNDTCPVEYDHMVRSAAALIRRN